MAFKGKVFKEFKKKDYVSKSISNDDYLDTDIVEKPSNALIMVALLAQATGNDNVIGLYESKYDEGKSFYALSSAGFALLQEDLSDIG
jgi:hypothetical protein